MVEGEVIGEINLASIRSGGIRCPSTGTSPSRLPLHWPSPFSTPGSGRSCSRQTGELERKLAERERRAPGRDGGGGDAALFRRPTTCGRRCAI